MEVHKILTAQEAWAKELCKTTQILFNARGSMGKEFYEPIVALAEKAVNQIHRTTERMFEMTDIKYSYRPYEFADGPSRLYQEGIPALSYHDSLMLLVKNTGQMKEEILKMKSLNTYITAKLKLLRPDDKFKALMIEVDATLDAIQKYCNDILAGKAMEEEKEDELLEEKSAVNTIELKLEEVAKEVAPEEKEVETEPVPLVFSPAPEEEVTEGNAE